MIAGRYTYGRTLFEPFMTAFICYCGQSEHDWPTDLKRLQTNLQQGIARKLTAVRNQLYFHAQQATPGNWKERYRLWHTLLMYDYGEANHLASLSDKEYLQSDYWQVFTHGLKQSCHSQGNPLDDLELQARPLCPRPLRGQEIILPQLFLQR